MARDVIFIYGVARARNDAMMDALYLKCCGDGDVAAIIILQCRVHKSFSSCLVTFAARATLELLCIVIRSIEPRSV